MKWLAFQHNDTTYDLCHLHPFEMEVVQPAKDKKPEQRFRFVVKFSLHCFAAEIKNGDDPALAYSDNRETRTFCFDRYRLSHHLPDIIRDIGAKRCSHTGKGNFFIVELIDDEGNQVEYEIYFDVTKGKPMELFIQSAYVRDDTTYRPKTKKISFYVIAHNRRAGKPIRTPK